MSSTPGPNHALPTPTALITGVAGQDGMYLARLLRANGWRVVGTVRPGISTLARFAPHLECVEIDYI